MTAKKKPLRIEFTPEQKEQIRQALGTEVLGFELAAEELEERVSPGSLIGRPGSLDKFIQLAPSDSPALNVGLVDPLK